MAVANFDALIVLTVPGGQQGVISVPSNYYVLGRTVAVQPTHGGTWAFEVDLGSNAMTEGDYQRWTSLWVNHGLTHLMTDNDDDGFFFTIEGTGAVYTNRRSTDATELARWKSEAPTLAALADILDLEALFENS